MQWSSFEKMGDLCYKLLQFQFHKFIYVINACHESRVTKMVQYHNFSSNTYGSLFITSKKANTLSIIIINEMMR